MIAPVLGEAFINLIILLLAKEDVKKDKKLYEYLIRKQIYVRIKSLHLLCDHFENKIDSESDSVKEYLTLMNLRNDFLHGNIDPLKLRSRNVFFDGTIPLFRDAQCLVSKVSLDSIRHIEPENATNDIEVVRKFIVHVLEQIHPSVREQVRVMMQDSQPGWNEKTGGVGILFSEIVEFYPIVK